MRFKKMEKLSVKSLLTEAHPENISVLVQGWVRTRRDSKAGISFIQLNDGSCFESLQIVVSNELPNYQSDILKLTTGCSITVQGKLVASTGGKQTVEVYAQNISVVGWIEDPDTYPISAKRHTLEYLRE